MKYLDKTGVSRLWSIIKLYASNLVTSTKSIIDNYTINGYSISSNPNLTKSDINLSNVLNVEQIPSSEKGSPNGVATLDSNGHIESSLLSLKGINGQSIIGEGNITIDLTLYKLVSQLPTTNIDSTKIYLVKNLEGPDNNSYIEYIYVNNLWEKLGEHKSDVDLSSYVKFTDIASTSKSGAMSTSMVTKLNGIEDNANNYVHPTGPGNKHIPAGGLSGLILRWASDGTALWGNDNDTTYSVANPSSNGLMSATDKKKLDGIDEGANKTIVDNALSSVSANPVLNSVIYTALSKKSDIGHTHSISQIDDLQNLLNNKSNSNHNHNSSYISQVGISGNNLVVTKNGTDTTLTIPYATNSTSSTSASLLATARTLWGQKFNGTANVSGDMSGVGHITGSGILYLESNDQVALCLLNKNDKSVTLRDGSFKPYEAANNNVDLGSSAAKWKNLFLGSNAYIDGNVGIGTNAPTQKLDVNGTVKATTFVGNLDWDYIAGEPTTLSGYGITDAYTKTDSDNRYVNLSGDTMTGRLYMKLSGRTDSIGMFQSSGTNKGGLVLRDTDGTEHVLYLSTSDLEWKGRTVWDSGNDGIGSGLDADLLDGVHANGLLTALTSSSSTNLSITIGGTTKTVADLYATKAAQFLTARTINGTAFNGTANVTTSSWGTARNIYIQDSNSSHTGAATSVNGSTNYYLKLPSTITANLVGNADTATNADTLDNVHLNGIFTGFSANGNSTRLIIGGVTKDLTVPYATKAGYLSTSGKLSGSLADITNSGYLYYSGGSNTVEDKPSGVDAFGLFTMQTAGGWNGQLLMSSNASTGMYWRTAMEFSGGWRKLLDSSNYNEYSPTKTGVGASGTWGISISGNANTATQLASSHTIWGLSFNGSGNVSGSMTGVTNITATGEIKSSAANAFRLSYGNYGTILRNDGLSFYILLTNKGLASSGSYNSLRPFSIELESGNVVMEHSLTVNGTITNGDGISSNGSIQAAAFYEKSDENIKENILNISDTYKVSQVEFKEFNFKGDSTKKYGVIALLLEKVGLENLVLTNNGIKSVDYISLLVLKIQLLEEEIKLLKNG